MRLFGSRRRKGTAVTIDDHFGDPQASRLLDALTTNPLDWSTAREIFATAASQEHLSLYLELAAPQQRLGALLRDGPLQEDPDDVLALLLSGVRAISWAWEIRGTGKAETVAGETWRIWFDRLREAEDFLHRVVELDPRNVEAWHYLILSGRARQLPKEELWRRYRRLVALDPTHHGGHRQMLEALKAQWGGSEKAMFNFARASADRAPGSGLPVLIADAHLEASSGHRNDEYFRHPEVAQELVLAAEYSIWHPAFTPSLFTRWVRNCLAYALARAHRFTEADRVFAEIGDDEVTRHPWELEPDDAERAYVRFRAHVHRSLWK
jgi:hypothetical protein